MLPNALQENIVNLSLMAVAVNAAQSLLILAIPQNPASGMDKNGAALNLLNQYALPSIGIS
jgi:hypothetical protein